MALCDTCQLEMLAASSCTSDAPVRRYGDEIAPLSSGHRCRDCNVAKGGIHHVGCLMAECTACDQQYGLCGGTECDEVRRWATGSAA